ncbi:MAG: 2-oxoacid:acceptor oxidoreductase subunit alpha [Pseudomonadota bacterium]
MKMYEGKTKLIQGNEACAEGALYAGCRFYGGYPITPSTEIAEHLAFRLPMLGGKFIQMEDEIAAMASVIGASFAGLKSMTATSGPGFSLKQENIGFACITEVPCVIVDIMRGGPSTGQPTGPSQSDIQQARWGTHGDHPVICLAPNSIEESFWETVRAFNLSEKYRNPVIIVIDEIIAHMREKFTFPYVKDVEIFDRKKPSVKPQDYLPYDDSKTLVPEMANFGEGYRFHATGLNHDKTGFPINSNPQIQKDEERLMAKINQNLDDILKTESYRTDDAEYLFVSFGSTARSAKVAVDTLRSEGVKIGLFRPITLWPFPEKEFENLAAKMKKIIVAEMNLGQLVIEVERYTDRKKVSHVGRVDGEPVKPQQIIDKYKEVI